MDKRFLLLMVVFLAVALVPTVICILYPPQLAIIEQPTESGINVSLNNWYKTRDYPSAELPEKFYTKKSAETIKQIAIEYDKIDSRVKVRFEDGTVLRCVQFYDAKGVHQQTTYLANNKKSVSVKKLPSDEYWVLLDIDGTVYLKKVLIT